MYKYNTIFDYILGMETQFKTGKIPLTSSWNWSFRDHIHTSESYINSQLANKEKGDYDIVKNITKPILNLQHRSEDVDVKDVQLYVDDPKKYHLSFLVKKYHDDVFVQENDMDTFFDELNIQRIDFGAGLSKKLNMPRPEVVPLQSIAFCDQTDILSGPIGIKHYYSPDQLLDMKDKGWGRKSNGATASVEELIQLSREEKKDDNDVRLTKTPGRYIEVYEVHGNLPKSFSNPYDDSEKYETRLWIVAFYQRLGKKDKGGIVLFSQPEDESPFKLIKRSPIYGRALGLGGAEELFEDQVWTNYGMKRKLDMIDAAAKTIMLTQDPAIAKKTNLKNLDNLDIIEEAPNGNTRQLDTFPRNFRLFDQWDAELLQHAKDIGAAQDPLQGIEPASGTPFASLQAQIQQGLGLHEYYRKQYCRHLEEIYRDWIIPHIQREITKGITFLSELSLEDLQYVTDSLVECETQNMIKEKILNGEAIDKQMEDQYREIVKAQFQKRGNKMFIEILKGEFKNTPLAVKVSIAGASKNLSQMTDKVVNIFRFAFSNPQGFAQVMQIPGMAKSFNAILEYSGLEPADFSGIDKLANPPQPAPQPQGQPGQPQPSPIQPQPQPAKAY